MVPLLVTAICPHAEGVRLAVVARREVRIIHAPPHLIGIGSNIGPVQHDVVAIDTDADIEGLGCAGEQFHDVDVVGIGRLIRGVLDGYGVVEDQTGGDTF